VRLQELVAASCIIKRRQSERDEKKSEVEREGRD
jgi:hypothetical protein